MSSSDEQQQDALVGQKVGNYRVTRLIGRGGMGSVYEALHEQINRRAAIKLLHPETNANPELGKRFINEARAVNQITHPGIVQVFDFGTLPTGEPYIAMEYLEGETLGARIDRLGRLPERDVARIGRQLASALSAAHEKQIIHRDLKPENIILVVDKEASGRERAKVLDFGIAKVSTPGGGKGTRTHAILGTAPYMSPEQCRGSSQITERTDVYALGIMLYEMLTGKPPFVAEEDVEVMTMHLKTPPPPIRKLVPSVSIEMEELIGRLLAKAPAERPTMAEVAELFDQQFPASMSGTLSVMKNLPEPRRSLKGPLILALVGALVLGGGAAIGLHATAVPPSQQTTASLVGNKPSSSELPKPPVLPSVTAEVQWEITSEPSGVVLLDAVTMKELGRTPWRQSQPAADGERKLLLRKTGYVQAEVLLRNGASEQKHVKLQLKVIDL